MNERSDDPYNKPELLELELLVGVELEKSWKGESSRLDTKNKKENKKKFKIGRPSGLRLLI